MSRRRLTVPGAAVLGGLLGFLLPVNAHLENTLNRSFPSPLDSRLVLVAIDDASLRDYGRLDVWPRELYAAALSTLREAGVRAAGVDLLLSAPTENDAMLGRALSRLPVVLATSPDDIMNPFPSHWKVIPGVSALNPPVLGAVRDVQTGYPTGDTGELVPSFARQVAAQLAPALPLNTAAHMLRFTPEENLMKQTVSFRDVVNGNIRFADLQGKVAVIGLTARGMGNTLPDLGGLPQPGSVMQLRAISSLLSAPFTRLPVALLVLLCAATAALAAWSRGLWGYVLALLTLSISVALWKANVSFPGVTVSSAAILGTLLFALEQWWRGRRLHVRDPLTGFGNRVAFTRVMEQRWATRSARPLGLLLLDVDNLRLIQEINGRLAGEQVLRAVGTRLQEGRRRGDVVFRWSPEEFAVLLDPNATNDLPGAQDHYLNLVTDLSSQDVPVVMNAGGAVADSLMVTPGDLLEAASRHRYRMKYQREQDLK